MPLSKKNQTNHIRGYIEGYYGKLLSWTERTELVRFLASLQLNTYCYAPKEDPQHRLRWREHHNPQWHEAFRKLSEAAECSSVALVAGIAPGLDFNFQSGSDFDCLLNKTQQYINSGATGILLLWDDIDDVFTADISISEGTAHARTVNQLSEALDQPVWTVPRVYADEIENNNNYLEDFFNELQSQHTVLLCGKAIVASKVQHSDLQRLSRAANNTIESSAELKHRTVVWDNFYANDYCPRRLFIGPWTGRDEVSDYLINPTGMPHTDNLILDITASTHTSANDKSAWQDALTRHGVPDAFLAIAPYFLSPCFGDTIAQEKIDSAPFGVTSDKAIDQAIDQAIEDCLWKWKSPLAREWYPFIMSLKHDLALVQGTLPIDRILKTQTSCLSRHLLKDF